MKSFFKKIYNSIVGCPRCYGMGVKELPNGETIECTHCNGRGYLN